MGVTKEEVKEMYGQMVAEVRGRVYVVTSGEYSSYHIDAVFSNYEMAERYCALLTDKHDYNYESPHIEEYDQDLISVNGKVYRGLTFREVQGKSKYVDMIKTFISLNPIEKTIKKHTNSYGEKVLAVTIPIYVRVDEEEAEKIAYDWLARYKAEEQGL